MAIARLTRTQLEEAFPEATIVMNGGGARKRKAALANCLNGLHSHYLAAAPKAWHRQRLFSRRANCKVCRLTASDN